MLKDSDLVKIIKHPAVSSVGIDWTELTPSPTIFFTMSLLNYSIECFSYAHALVVNDCYYMFDVIDDSTIKGKLRFMSDDGECVIELPVDENKEPTKC